MDINSHYSHKNRDLQNNLNNKRMNYRDMVDMQLNLPYGRDNHKKNVQRTIMERGIFNQDTRMEVEDKELQKGHNVGEITGEELDESSFDQGMPLRSQYTIKKSLHDENQYLDFDIYDRHKKNNTNVGYFDPENGNSTNFSDIRTAMASLSKQIEPKSICSEGVNRMGLMLCDIFTSTMPESFIINSFSLYNSLACLFMPSSGNTEVELKNYCKFPKRDLLKHGLSTMTTTLNKITNMIDLKTFVIFGSHIPYNDRYYDNIKDFCIMKRISMDHPEEEANLINKLVNRIMGKELRKTVIGENLINSDLLVLNVGSIVPIWNVAFDGVKKGIFDESRSAEFMYTVGKTFGYHEDNIWQHIEMRCVGDTLTMGIIMPKEIDIQLDMIDEKDLMFNIQHLKGTVLDEVIIPIFKQNTKVRFTNTLKSTSLQSVFIATEMPDLFGQKLQLNDVMQNINIDIGPRYSENGEESRGYRTTRKFIANRPFYYYFRLIPTNTILLMGKFS